MFSKQMNCILNEGLSYEEIANIYNTSEDILKQAKAAGLTLVKPNINSSPEYVIQQFREVVGEQLKSGKELNLKILGSFFNETSNLNNKAVFGKDLNENDIENISKAKKFLKNSETILSNAKHSFKSSVDTSKNWFTSLSSSGIIKKTIKGLKQFGEY